MVLQLFAHNPPQKIFDRLLLPKHIFAQSLIDHRLVIPAPLRIGLLAEPIQDVRDPGGW